MPRTPPCPDLDVRTPSQLRRELLKLHTWAGAPGARRLVTVAAGLGRTLARSTTQDLISGARTAGLPARDFVESFALACLTHAECPTPDVGAKQWDEAWLKVVQAHGQIPTTPVRPRTTSSHRVILITAAVAVVVLVSSVLIFRLTSPEDPPATSAAGIQDIYCAPDGLTASWQNHHSQLYLTATLEVLAAPPGEFKIARQESPEIDGCTHQLATGNACLEAADEKAEVTRCANRPEQRWVIENHWYNEGVMWKRLHPSQRPDLCLQQQSAEEAVRAVLKLCDTNWIQQWQLKPIHNN